MTMRNVLAAVVAVLTLAGCEKPPPNAGQKTMQGQSMARMLAAVDLIRAYTLGQTSQAAATQAALELLSWSDRIGELFPPDVAPTQYVDLTADMAKAAPAVMHANAANLLAAVQSGSVPAATEALDRTERDGCGLCHRTPYR